MRCGLFLCARNKGKQLHTHMYLLVFANRDAGGDGPGPTAGVGRWVLLSLGLVVQFFSLLHQK